MSSDTDKTQRLRVPPDRTIEMSVLDDLPAPHDGGLTAEEHQRLEARAAATPAPRLADGIDLVGEYEGSGFKDPPYLARRSDGQMVQMAKLLYFVAEEIDGETHYDEIAERVSAKFQRGLDAEMTQMLVEEKLVPLGIVAAPDGSEPELKKVDPLLALKFRAAVVPEGLVNGVTRVFRPLFLPPVVATVLLGLVGLDVWLFAYHGVAQSIRSTLYDPLFILLLLGLVVLSAAFHECGHATACAYGGARPGVMGVGLYIVWPAFYTDVTDAYRLGKAGRLRTDLGGVYFNTIFILLTAGAYFVTGFEPLLLVIPLQHIEILHQFLPFIRLDGYYIVSDLTGVPDMFLRIKPVLKSLLPWKQADESVTELKRWARVVVTVYVLTLIPALFFLLGLTVMNMPRVFATAYDSFLQTSHKLGHAGVLSGAIDIVQLIVLVLVPLGLVLTFVQLGRKAAAGAWRVTDGRPARRALLVAGAAAVAGFAAYTWIPSSNYAPIMPFERGTIQSVGTQISALPSGHPAVPNPATFKERRQRYQKREQLRQREQANGKTQQQRQTSTTTTVTTATTTARSTTPTSTVSTSTTTTTTIPAATTPTDTTTTPAVTTPTETATTPVTTTTP